MNQLVSLASAGILFALGLLFRQRLVATPYSLAEYVVFLAAYLIVAKQVILTALRNVVKGKLFDENFLMTIATAGAIAIGEFPEAVGVMFFYYIGELFQEIAVNRSRRSIKSLMDIRPDYANLKLGSAVKQVNPQSVQVGDLILVRPGERIPLDGEVLNGESFVDASAITGEAVPVPVSPGQIVLAGSINGSGVLTVRVSKTFQESSLAKMLDLVENAANRKATTEKFITKFARYYTPVVVLAAAGLAVAPPLLIPGAAFSQWLRRALILLVISCPCALVVSIPLGYFGGIGGASKRGILVKGANYLEALVNVDTVVFDKTGTLTKGIFRVSRILPANGFREEELLRLAAGAEVYSNHPIAKSILEAYGYPVDGLASDSHDEIVGRGVRAQVDGREVLVGNGRLMEREGVAYSLSEDAGSVAYVAVDGVYAGSILISDQVREDAAEGLRRLRNVGVSRTVMLTGDNEKIAKQVARELGIDEVYAGLLPEDKVSRVEALLTDPKRRKGSKLAFVGDGINDAPVISRADIGVAMGGLGSDAAIEAADIVIMEDMPTKISEAIMIARQTHQIIVQNIVLALGVKALFILFGAMGAATLWEAVFADVGVALLAVLNATRALRTENEIGVCSSTLTTAHRI